MLAMGQEIKGTETCGWQRSSYLINAIFKHQCPEDELLPCSKVQQEGSKLHTISWCYGQSLADKVISKVIFDLISLYKSFKTHTHAHIYTHTGNVNCSQGVYLPISKQMVSMAISISYWTFMASGYTDLA